MRVALQERIDGFTCEVLPWDSAWWGVRTGCITAEGSANANFDLALMWCRDHDIELAYLLVPTSNLAVAHAAEDSGFHFVDVRVTMSIDPSIRLPAIRHARNTTRRAELRDLPALRRIAAASHTGSRFFADPTLPTTRCIALYEHWIESSCSDETKIVRVAEVGHELAGYITCEIDRRAGRIGLVAVAPTYRGIGIGSGLVNAALQTFRDAETTPVYVITQGRNVAAQRLYQRCGFTAESTHLWFHGRLS